MDNIILIKYIILLMDNQNICFPLNSNFTDFSNNKYYFNNIINNDISYGLYETSGNDLSYIYVINNIPKISIGFLYR